MIWLCVWVLTFLHVSSSQTCEGNSCSTVLDDVVIPKGANTEGRPMQADPECVNRHPDCDFFVANSECEKNPGWMVVNCPFGCLACHLRFNSQRCTREFLNMTDHPAIEPGSITSIFEGIIANKNGNLGAVSVLSRDPWIVTIDNFVTDAAVNALLNNVEVWERSTDTGLFNEYGEQGRILSSGRTSSNSWCRHNCESHMDVVSLMEKIETTTTIPLQNYESLQILRYEIGQHYNTHHDTSQEDYEMLSGPRILTMFLYLSDVEEGGETEFPRLGLKVKPQKGKALLWPGVMDTNPQMIDKRTSHTALPVVRGRKFAANSWIHMNDFRTPNLWGCTGAFD